MSQKTFTRSDVAKHCTEEDAYIIVNDAVLDITRFAGMHPGGEKLLLQYAGKDATEDFFAMHKQKVLDKFRPRLQVGVVEGVKSSLKDDGVSEFGRLSKVPYAEASFWRGWKSTYYDESHYKLRIEVREFYDKHVREIAEESEESNEPCTIELMQKLGESGLLVAQLGPGPHLKLAPRLPGGIKPEKFDYFHEAIVHEEACRLQCPGFMDSMFAGFNISVPPVFNYGTEKMKREILPDLISGKKRACLAITEPFAGSDVANLRCTAVKSADGTHYIVNGVKKWITNATFSDYFVTAVRTGGDGAGGISMLMIERKHGVRTKLIKTSYSSSAGTGYVIFEDVKVPVENLMYKENRGFQAVMSNFNHERWVIAVGVIAGARYIVEECFKWAIQRKAFGKPLMSQAVIREKLGRMVAEVESVHAYLEVITHQMNNMSYEEQSVHLGGPISLLKYQATRVSHNVADQSVQIFGGRGVTKGGMGKAVETYQRTYKMPAVYGGSEEIMVDLGVRQAMRYYPKDAKL